MIGSNVSLSQLPHKFSFSQSSKKIADGIKIITIELIFQITELAVTFYISFLLIVPIGLTNKFDYLYPQHNHKPAHFSTASPITSLDQATTPSPLDYGNSLWLVILRLLTNAPSPFIHAAVCLILKIMSCCHSLLMASPRTTINIGMKDYKWWQIYIKLCLNTLKFYVVLKMLNKTFCQTDLTICHHKGLNLDLCISQNSVPWFHRAKFLPRPQDSDPNAAPLPTLIILSQGSFCAWFWTLHLLCGSSFCPYSENSNPVNTHLD